MTDISFVKKITYYYTENEHGVIFFSIYIIHEFFIIIIFFKYTVNLLYMYENKT